MQAMAAQPPEAGAAERRDQRWAGSEQVLGRRRVCYGYGAAARAERPYAVWMRLVMSWSTRRPGQISTSGPGGFAIVSMLSRPLTLADAAWQLELSCSRPCTSALTKGVLDDQPAR